MEITWDRWAVPTITGHDEFDVTYGLGRAQAMTNATLVLDLYGTARGGAAARWGARYLADDTFTAHMGLVAQTDVWFAAQSEQTLARVAAFCDGFNAACAEDESLGTDRRDVLPVTPRDVIAQTLRTIVRFSTLDYTGLAFEPTAFQESAGSNGWAVSARLSSTGEALLIVNPHTLWKGYQRWFETHSISPGRDFHGIGFVGMPWQTMGYSDVIGWGHTVNPIPNMSVYELAVENGTYRFDGQRCPVQAVEHTIEVLGGDPVTVTERHSVHGPIVTAPDGADVAVRVAGVLHHATATALESWWRMSQAGSVEELFATHDETPLPMFNMIAADRHGSVGALYCGTPPVRGPGGPEDLRRRLPGEDPTWLWDAVHPASAMPRVIDPPCGWVQNCNEPPWLYADPALPVEAYPPLIAPGPDDLQDLRPLSSRGWLTQQESISPDGLLGLKFDKRALLADIALDELCREASAEEDLATAVEVLRSWDRHAHHDSAGYVLFFLWAMANRPVAMEGVFLRPAAEPGGVPAGLADPAAAVVALRDTVSMMSGLGVALDASIGQVLTLGADAVPADGGSGITGVLKALQVVPTETGFELTLADNWVSLVRFGPDGPPTADSLLVYGNTSEPGAPPADSQYGLWAADRLRPRDEEPVP